MSSSSNTNKKSVRLITAVEDPALEGLTQSERAVTKLLEKKVENKAPKITPMPRSAVLDRVLQFLPQIEEANKKLNEVEDKSEVDIEKIAEEHKDSYIQFNLALADLEDERVKFLDDTDLSSESETEAESKDCKQIITEL